MPKACVGGVTTVFYMAKHFKNISTIVGASAFSVVVHILISQTPKTGVSF